MSQTFLQLSCVQLQLNLAVIHSQLRNYLGQQRRFNQFTSHVSRATELNGCDAGAGQIGQAAGVRFHCRIQRMNKGHWLVERVLGRESVDADIAVCSDSITKLFGATA